MAESKGLSSVLVAFYLRFDPQCDSHPLQSLVLTPPHSAT